MDYSNAGLNASHYNNWSAMGWFAKLLVKGILLIKSKLS